MHEVQFQMLVRNSFRSHVHRVNGGAVKFREIHSNGNHANRILNIGHRTGVSLAGENYRSQRNEERKPAAYFMYSYSPLGPM